MNKNLTFIDPICGKPGFHIDQVPQPMDQIDYRRFDLVNGRAANPADPLICGSCGRHLLVELGKDGARLTDPLNYVARKTTVNTLFHALGDMARGAELLERIACGAVRVASSVRIPRQSAGFDVIKSESLEPGEIRILEPGERFVVPHPQPHACHDEPGLDDDLLAVAADRQAKLVHAETTVVELQAQVNKLKRENELLASEAANARNDAQRRYEGMTNWKRTAENKDFQLGQSQRTIDKYSLCAQAVRQHIESTLPPGSAEEILRPFHDAGLMD